MVAFNSIVMAISTIALAARFLVKGSFITARWLEVGYVLVSPMVLVDVAG